MHIDAKMFLQLDAAFTAILAAAYWVASARLSSDREFTRAADCNYAAAGWASVSAVLAAAAAFDLTGLSIIFIPALVLCVWGTRNFTSKAGPFWK